MPRVGYVLAAEEGGDEEGENEKVLRAQIRSLEDLVVTLRQHQMDDRDNFCRAYGSLEVEKDHIIGERSSPMRER